MKKGYFSFVKIKLKPINPIFLFSSIFNIYSLRFLLNLFIKSLDFIIIFFIYMLIQAYRLPRDLIWVFIFYPIWALVQYCCLLIYEITCDLSYLFSHFFYLLVTSDVFDVEFKLRRLLVTTLILYYLCYIRLWRILVKFLNPLNKLSIIYYFFAIIKKLVLYFYAIIYQIIINIQDIFKVITYLTLQTLFIIPICIFHFSINSYKLYSKKNLPSLQQYIYNLIYTLGFDKNDFPEVMKPIFTNEAKTLYDYNVYKNDYNVIFFFNIMLVVLIYIPLTGLLNLIHKTLVYITYYISNILVQIILYLYMSLGYIILIPILILSYKLLFIAYYFIFFLKKKYTSIQKLNYKNSNPFNRIEHMLILNSLKTKDLQLNANTEKLERYIYQWLYYRTVDSLYDVIYPTSKKKLKELFFFQNHIYYRRHKNLLVSRNLAKLANNKNKLDWELIKCFEYKRVEIVSEYYNNFLNKSSTQKDKLNFICFLFYFFVKPYIQFIYYTLLLKSFYFFFEWKSKIIKSLNFKQTMNRTYYQYKEIFLSNQEEVEPFIARVYYFIKKYIKLVFNIFIVSSFFLLLPPIFLLIGFFYLLQSLFYLIVSKSNRHFLINTIIYTFMNSFETVLFFFLGEINRFVSKLNRFVSKLLVLIKIQKINLPIFINILNKILNWIIIICSFLLLSNIIIFCFYLGGNFFYLIQETLLYFVVNNLCSIKFMAYNLPLMESIIPYIWYNTYSIVILHILTYIDYIYFEYYRLYIQNILINNDLFMLENFFPYPRMNNKEGSLINILHDLTKHSKYNIVRHSIKRWRVKYDITLYYPQSLHTYYYYFLYNFYYQYIKFFFEYDTFTKGIAKPYFQLSSFIAEYIKTMVTPRYGKKGIDVLTMIYASFIVLTYFHKSYQYNIQTGFDQYPLNDVGMIIEDYIDPDLEFVNSEDHEAVDFLESERSNIYSLDSEWLPEYKMDYDMMIQGTEWFDTVYIESELEFDAKFNQLLNRENEYELFKKMYNSN